MSLHLKRPNSGRGWQPGNSGNPKGRPGRDSLQELCRAHTVEAVKTLIVMMRFKGPNQLPATLAILDRGHGKPTQRIESDGPDHLHLHLLAAQLVQPMLEAQPEPERQAQQIEGSVPTE
jgi:hypothetical protein